MVTKETFFNTNSIYLAQAMATSKKITSCNFYQNTLRQIKFQRNYNDKRAKLPTVMFGRDVLGLNVYETKLSSTLTLRVELKERKLNSDIC